MFAVTRIRNVPETLHRTLKARAALAEALDAPLVTARPPPAAARKSGFSESRPATGANGAWAAGRDDRGRPAWPTPG